MRNSVSLKRKSERKTTAFALLFYVLFSFKTVGFLRRSTEAKIASSPPSFSKFQIFFKNFPVLPLGKIASNFKNHKIMREILSLKLPWASSCRNRGALPHLLFHSVLGFHNLTENLSTAKARYAQGLLRFENLCFDDYTDN